MFNEHLQQTIIPAEFCFEPHNNGIFSHPVSLPLDDDDDDEKHKVDVVGAENQLLK